MSKPVEQESHTDAPGSTIATLPKQQVARKLDIQKALTLRVKHGLSYDAIGKQLGVSGTTVTRALAKFASLLDEPDLVNAGVGQYAGLLDAAKLKVLGEIFADNGAKLQRSSAAQLAVIMGILDDKSRLERGVSTANIHHLSLIIQNAHKTTTIDVTSEPVADDAEAVDNVAIE